MPACKLLCFVKCSLHCSLLRTDLANGRLQRICSIGIGIGIGWRWRSAEQNTCGGKAHNSFTVDGANASANLRSLIETCNASGIDPYLYLHGCSSVPTGENCRRLRRAAAVEDAYGRALNFYFIFNGE